MNQQRISRWPYLAILACLLATYAILPGLRRQNARECAGMSPQSVEVFPNACPADYAVAVLPPIDEINPSPLEAEPSSEVVMVKPCAAMLSEVSDSNDAE